MRYWLEMAIFLHLVFCVIRVYDVFEESNLKNKIKFSLLICLFPFGGILIFEAAKRRNKSLPLPSERNTSTAEKVILLKTVIE